jgi:anaerobic selenocysteine-containing dehydrogenase
VGELAGVPGGRAAGPAATFDSFVTALMDLYAEFTPEYAEAESGVPAARIVEAARAIGRAGTRFATHNWRAAASGNLWGWQITRCLYLLVVLTGSLGEVGGVNMHVTNKFVPKHPNPPPAAGVLERTALPREFPLSFHELSFLLPHFLKEGRGRLDVYFTRVYNPLWTNPDGFSWMEVLQDKDKIGLHVALTPTWSETAWFADYILPMGLGTERHDTMSQETHAGQWLGFRQPVLRVAREKRGETVQATYEANPGEVWEENEFWIALSWKIDPDGSLGIRRFFESPYRPGEQITVDEYYRWMFEHSVPGLPEAAAKENLAPLEYMRKYGVFKVSDKTYSKAHERKLTEDELAGLGADAAGETSSRRAGRRSAHGRRRRARRVQHAVATAGVLLDDDGRLGLARARAAPLRAGPRVLARSRPREKGEFDLLPELPAADAHPHALAGQVAVRDLAQQPALDRDRGRPRTASRPATW